MPGVQSVAFDLARGAGRLEAAGDLKRTLSASSPQVHFDEAWFAYALFQPLYAGRYGMAVHESSLPGPDRTGRVRDSVDAQAALSQPAMVHVRPARPARRAPVEYERFNEVLMMHGTTSPLYPVIVSLDVATVRLSLIISHNPGAWRTIATGHQC